MERNRQYEGGEWRALVRRTPLCVAALVSVLEGGWMLGCSWARTTAAVSAPSLPREAMLEVTEPAGVARSRWPVTVGVPFPRGAVRDIARLRLRTNTAATPVQARVLSRWPDGSVRWALLDWQADVRPHGRVRVHVAPDMPETPTAPRRTVHAVDRGDRLEVDTGPLQFTVPKNRFALFSAARVDGRQVISGPVAPFFDINGSRVAPQAASAVTVTEAGPLRLRIELRGRYSSTLNYVVRIDAFAGQPFVRVLHTFEERSPEFYTWVRQIGVDVPMRLKGNAVFRAGQEKGAPWAGPLRASGFKLVQEDNDVLHVNGTRRTARAAGWVDLHDATHGVAVAARFFWQEYPQSFELRPNGLTYNLWAPDAAPARVGMGVAKTHELVFYFSAKAPPSSEMLAVLARPLLARLDASWTESTGAFANSLAPSKENLLFLHKLQAGYRLYQAHADTDRWDDSGRVYCPDAAHEHPRQGFFGMFNWGDWNFPGYHDTTKGCDAWGNLEYDMTQVLALAYAATGDSAYFERMVAAARHFMDVDRIHYQREHPDWVGMNHPKNPLHFAFELGGPDPGHTWTEGLLSYYYLTGDERALEASRGIADYLVRRLRPVVLRGNPRQWGWPQIALIAAYDATGNEAYKTAAQEYARRGMAAHPPDKVDHWKMGVLAEALTYTHAVTQDPTIREWLLRYAAAVSARGAGIDPRFFPAVAYVGRIAHKPECTRAATASVARLKFSSGGKPFTIAGRLGFRILSIAAARALPGPPAATAARDAAPDEQR
jgi:hypothetical protein